MSSFEKRASVHVLGTSANMNRQLTAREFEQPHPTCEVPCLNPRPCHRVSLTSYVPHLEEHLQSYGSTSRLILDQVYVPKLSLAKRLASLPRVRSCMPELASTRGYACRAWKMCCLLPPQRKPHETPSHLAIYRKGATLRKAGGQHLSFPSWSIGQPTKRLNGLWSLSLSTLLQGRRDSTPMCMRRASSSTAHACSIFFGKDEQHGEREGCQMSTTQGNHLHLEIIPGRLARQVPAFTGGV